MTVASVPIAAAMRTGVWRNRAATTSANVYFPRFRSGSAIRNRTTGQPTSQPVE
jgi:hypothetical protein